MSEQPASQKSMPNCKFYDYRQNNSGGAFCEPAMYVIVEAPNPEIANGVAESKGLYWNGVDEGCDCPCCGDRWYPAGCFGDEGPDEPTVYGEVVEPVFVESEGDLPDNLLDWSVWGAPKGVIYYLDGRIAHFVQVDKPKATKKKKA